MGHRIFIWTGLAAMLALYILLLGIAFHLPKLLLDVRSNFTAPPEGMTALMVVSVVATIAAMCCATWLIALTATLAYNHLTAGRYRIRKVSPRGTNYAPRFFAQVRVESRYFGDSFHAWETIGFFARKTIPGDITDLSFRGLGCTSRDDAEDRIRRHQTYLASDAARCRTAFI